MPRKAKMPRLSPSFLTQEDAAYWVHSKIPDKPDKEYGSVIVRLPDGLFAATQPVPGQVNRFDFSTLIEVDASGKYVQPKGYTCVANVHSHPPAHDQIRNANPGQDELTLRLFISFFSDLDFMADVGAKRFFASAYLSGPDGTLLKYSPSDSKEELAYYRWLEAGAPQGDPAGVYGVANVIRKVASVGELEVIVSNADWGNSVGKVPADWRPGTDLSKGAVTAPALMTRVCSSAAQAVLAALKKRTAQTSGLVLKQLATEHYVATQARTAGRSSWDPEHFFPRGADGQLQLPAGYALEGFYYASRQDPAKLPRLQPWLYEGFFTPEEMALAIACHAKSKPLSAPDRPLSLYMQAMDSALLKYGFSGSEIEATLSVENPDGSIGDAGLHARMLAGTLRPREFISVLALGGRLEVLRGSPLWASIGPVGLDWVPFAGFALPALGPAFLSADDAARYIHERIGSQRDRRYAGYIFQRIDQRFVPTEPLVGSMEKLVLGQLYPRDLKGNPVFPEDHLLQARYVSHEALSMLDPATVERLKWSRQEAALSLQMFSVEEMRRVLFDEIPLYLSGAKQSLISFAPFTASSTQELVTRLGTKKLPGPLAIALDSGALRPVDFIREQAAAGRLTTLLDSDFWGPRGQISPSWSVPSVPSVPWGWKRPEHVAFGAIFPSADAAAEDRYARDARLHDQERAWFGFILKHQDRDEYVATELVPVIEERNNVFQLKGVFGIRTTPPWYQYPEGFNRHAAFYSRQRVKHPSGKPRAWLAEHFITLDDLYIAGYYSRRRPVTESDKPIPLYMSTQDGALLKYVKRKNSKLFDEDTPQMSLEEIKANLNSGKLLPAEFVRVVANSGKLKVLRTSMCWDRALPVGLDWQPYMNLQRRWLGALFHSSDDAAVDARSRIPEGANTLYGGLLLKRADGLYLATDPIEVSREDFDASEIYPDAAMIAGLFPAGCRVTGRYRSRVPRELAVVLSEIEKQTYMNMLSVDTLYTAFARPSESALDEYLFGPDGSLIRYRTGLLSRLRADLSNALTGYKNLPDDLNGQTIKHLIHRGDLKPSVWVDSLTRSGYLQVVTGSRLWGPPGPVKEWAPYPAADTMLDYARADVYPVCSPAFVQADAAARYAHQACGHRTAQTFGCILWSRWSSLFIASRPIEVQHSSLALDRIFPQATLISGFALDALYLSAQAPAEGAMQDDGQQHFFSPTDVRHLCSRANTHQGYKPVYFSCADGALLRFEMAPFEPGVFYDRAGQIELRRNSFASLEQATNDERDIAKGTFDFPGYVRRMARAGKLDVIETSAYWSRHGKVDEHWQPRLPDVSSDERWRAKPVPPMGPIFHSADDAARYVQHRAGSAYTSKTGYESATLARVTLNRFVALEPVAYTGEGDSPLLRLFRTVKDPSITWRNPAAQFPEGYALMACHQLYLSGNTALVPDTEKVYANFASVHQVYLHTHALKNKGFQIRDYYYSTLHGVLLRYTPLYTKAEESLLLTEPAEFKGGRWVARLTPDQFISRIVELGDFRVLLAGEYWRQTGRLGAQWRIRRQQSPSLGIMRHRDEL